MSGRSPASDTDALQFGSPITSLAVVLTLAKVAALAEARVCRGPRHELILTVSTDDREQRVRLSSVILLVC